LSPLALLVEFEIKPDAVTRFRDLVIDNARQSLETEPGCRRFDVCVAPDDRRRVVLYEIYDDAQAFDRHLETGHYKSFAAAISDIVASRSIRRLALIEPGLARAAKRGARSPERSIAETRSETIAIGGSAPKRQTADESRGGRSHDDKTRSA
jgi:autoinducer 2-degrading protein